MSGKEPGFVNDAKYVLNIGFCGIPSKLHIADLGPCFGRAIHAFDRFLLRFLEVTLACLIACASDDILFAILISLIKPELALGMLKVKTAL